MIDTLLGKLSPKEFLRKYWQKKPLLIRQALPNFQGILTKTQLIALSANEDVLSRLVHYHRSKWKLDTGPFRKRDFVKPIGKWALLVQGINHYFPAAQALINHFNFIPYARLDDLMISVSSDGGGVGPHFDSYDVFLLQGSGKRLWQISKQENRRLLADAPLRILKHFKPEQEWLLEPGDMLYLPPNYAHNGIAVGECMTYSIGFRAPSFQELNQEFLAYLQERCNIEGIYSDPDLSITKQPAQISKQMIAKVTTVLNKLCYNKAIIADFLGCYLSAPKANIFFETPDPPVTKNSFIKLIKQHGVRLDLKSQMLYSDKAFFINGETCSFNSTLKSYLKTLANTRELKLPASILNKVGELFYGWYLDGYIKINIPITPDSTRHRGQVGLTP